MRIKACKQTALKFEQHETLRVFYFCGRTTSRQIPKPHGLLQLLAVGRLHSKKCDDCLSWPGSGLHTDFSTPARNSLVGRAFSRTSVQDVPLPVAQDATMVSHHLNPGGNLDT